MRQGSLDPAAAIGQSPSRLWPVLLHSVAQLPPGPRALAEPALGGESAEKILLVPWDSQPTRWWRMQIVPSRAFILTPRRVVMVRGEEDGEPGESWACSRAALLALEWGEILLYSWLKVTAATPGGPSEARLEYNSVGRADVATVVDALLATPVPPDRSGGTDTVPPSHTAGLPLKFRNALDRLVMPWDHLQALVYQPQQTERWLGVVRRVRTAEAVLALTTNELILIREEAPLLAQSRRWGTITTYLPRRHIWTARLEPRAEAVRLHVVAGDERIAWHLSHDFAAELAAPLTALLAHLRANGAAQEIGASETDDAHG